MPVIQKYYSFGPSIFTKYVLLTNFISLLQQIFNPLELTVQNDPGLSRPFDFLEKWPLIVSVRIKLSESNLDIVEAFGHAQQLLQFHKTFLILVNYDKRLPSHGANEIHIGLSQH